MTSDYILKASTHQEILLQPEELRLLMEHACFSPDGTFQVYERFSSGKLALLDLPQLNVPDGMILWYKNCADARQAFLNLSRLAKIEPPPITIRADLADLDSFELSHGMAIRSFTLFKSGIECWLHELNLEPGEEEIEQGPQVMEYFLQNATILQSANLNGAPVPHDIDEIIRICGL